MYSFKNYFSKVKTYFRFGNAERLAVVLSIVISSIVLWFVFSKVENNVLPLIEIFNYLLIVSLVVLLQQSTQKLFALSIGYTTFYTKTPIASMISFVFGMFGLPFIAPGKIIIKDLPRHRIGRFRPGPNEDDKAWIAFSGVFALLFTAVIFYLLSNVARNPEIFKIASNIALLFAVFNMLPLPSFNGLQIFFGSRYLYLATLAFTLIFSSILYVSGLVLAILFGALATIAFVLWFFVVVDKSW